MAKLGERRQEHLLTAPLESPLGRAVLAGKQVGGQGVQPFGAWRVYGSYALVVVTAGSGRYRDASGVAAEVVAGDALLVFPELPHWYGPRRGGRWDEVYVAFDGPAFVLLREAGLLEPTRPVRRLGAAGGALAERLEAWAREAAACASAEGGERTRHLNALQALLVEVLTREAAAPGDATRPEWLAATRARLETDLSSRVSLSGLAAEVGLGYETFRKRFQQETGSSPARYRLVRRIEAAQQLLRFTPSVTNRELAAALGFADEFHFSRRFTEIAGESPRAFRRRFR